MQIPVQFFGDDVFIKLLPDDRIISLVGFYDTIDAAKQVLLKDIFDMHGFPLVISSSHTTSRNAR
ncbi:MAG: hypothetical protein ACOYL3_06465 [Desulfuromonadaceae bacterium]